MSDKSADKSVRIVVRVRLVARGKLNGEVGEDVRVGVGVSPIEFKLNSLSLNWSSVLRSHISQSINRSISQSIRDT